VTWQVASRLGVHAEWATYPTRTAAATAPQRRGLLSVLIALLVLVIAIGLAMTVSRMS